MIDQPTVAIVGLGKMGLVHGAAVTVSGGRIVGLVDLRASSVRNARWIGLQAPFYSSLDDLFCRLVPDAVFVSVPSNANLSVARTCRQAGVRGIFLEKPLAESVDSANELVHLANGPPPLVDAVGFMMRHVPTFRHARGLIQDGAIGLVRSVEAEAYMDAQLPTAKNWFRQKATSGGGCLVSLGSHLLDLLDAILGPVVSVRSVTLAGRVGEVEDRAKAEISYPDAVHATISVGWDMTGYDALHVAMAFRGTDGELIADLQRVSLEKSTGRRVWTERHLSEDAPGFVGGRGYVRQDTHFLAAVTGQAAERVSWEEGRRVQDALARLYSAAEPAS